MSKETDRQTCYGSPGLEEARNTGLGIFQCDPFFLFWLSEAVLFSFRWSSPLL